MLLLAVLENVLAYDFVKGGNIDIAINLEFDFMNWGKNFVGIER
jgi:hypothetical protein